MRIWFFKYMKSLINKDLGKNTLIVLNKDLEKQNEF